MKNSELVKLLQSLPSDMDVFVAYDSMVCVAKLSVRHIAIVAKKGEEFEMGIYFGANSGAGTCSVVDPSSDDYCPSAYIVEPEKVA